MEEIVMKKIMIGIVGAIAVIFIVAVVMKLTSTEYKIASAVKAGETKIDLKEVTNTEWTNVGIMIPYTSDEAIEEYMDIEFTGNNRGIDMLDDRFLLVFADDKTDVKTVKLSNEELVYHIEDNRYLIIEKRTD